MLPSTTPGGGGEGGGTRPSASNEVGIPMPHDQAATSTSPPASHHASADPAALDNPAAQAKRRSLILLVGWALLAGAVTLSLVVTIWQNETQHQQGLVKQVLLPSRVMLGPPPSLDVPILGTHCCTTEYGLEASAFAAAAASVSRSHGGKNQKAPSSLEAQLFRQAVVDAAGIDSTGSNNKQRLWGGVYLVMTQHRGEGDLEGVLGRLDKHFTRLHKHPVVVFLAAWNLTQEAQDRLRAAAPSTTIDFRPLPRLQEQYQAAEAIPHDHAAEVAAAAAAAKNGKLVAITAAAAAFERSLWEFRVSEAPRLLSEQYEWVLHLSEDTLLTEDVLIDPFEALKATNRKLGYMATHRAVDEESLWAFGRSFALQHQLGKTGKVKQEAALHRTWNVAKAIDARWIAFHQSVFTSELYQALVVGLAASSLTQPQPTTAAAAAAATHGAAAAAAAPSGASTISPPPLAKDEQQQQQQHTRAPTAFFDAWGLFSDAFPSSTPPSFPSSSFTPLTAYQRQRQLDDTFPTAAPTAGAAAAAASNTNMLTINLPDPSAVLTLGSLITLTPDDFMQYRGLNLQRPPKKNTTSSSSSSSSGPAIEGLSPEEAAGITRSSWRGVAITASEAEDLQPLFAVRNEGWLGADVATSFRFPPSKPGGKEGGKEDEEQGKYIWLFGDTLLGYASQDRRLSGAFFLHNSVAFLPAFNMSDPSVKGPKAEDVMFSWNVSMGGCPTSIFIRGPSVDDECVHTQEYLWPISGMGVSYMEGGKEGVGEEEVSKVVVLAVRWAYVKSLRVSVDLFDDNVFNFEILGTTAIVVDDPHADPSMWEYRQKDIPGTDGNLNWYSAMMHGSKGAELATGPDDVIYLFGVNNTEAEGTPPQQWQYETLARLPARSLVDLTFKDMEVWALTKPSSSSSSAPPAQSTKKEKKDTASSSSRSSSTPSGRPNTTWAAYPTFLHKQMKAAPLVFPVFSETSVQYSEALGAYYGVVVDWLSSHIVLYLADDLTQEWEPVVVYKIPPPFDDPAVYMTYAGKTHPELARNDEIILTFMTNAPGDLEPLFETGAKDVYVPRFLRLTLEKPSPEAPAAAAPADAAAAATTVTEGAMAAAAVARATGPEGKSAAAAEAPAVP